MGLTATAYYKTIYEPRKNAPPIKIDSVEPEKHQEQFARPLVNGHPWDQDEGKESFIRQLFYLKRLCYLALLFAPIGVLGAISAVTGNQTIREYFLEQLISTLEAAGCAFQKLGQWLSMRPDMFAPDTIAALAKLRDSAPTHSMKHTRRMIRESFGKEIEEVFEEFSLEPIASGTVAQVHRAKLRPEFRAQHSQGEYVAVKVRHPNVLSETWVDVDLIFLTINNSQLLTIPFSKLEFVESLQQQVNLKWEAYNMHQFAQNFKKEVNNGFRQLKLCFPEVNAQLLSNQILVESWAEGNTVSEIFTSVGDGFKIVPQKVGAIVSKTNELCDEIVDKTKVKIKEVDNELEILKKELAALVFDVNIKMFLRDNLCHGDLHAGNVLFSKDQKTLTLLDAGLTTSLRPDVQGDFGRFLHSICTGNIDTTVSHILAWDERPDSSDPGLSDAQRKTLTADVQKSFAKFVADPTPGMLGGGKTTAPDGGPVSIGDLVGDIFFKLQKNGVKLRGDVAASLVTISVSEGLIRQLDPEFDIVSSALPYFVRFNGWQSTKAVVGNMIK